jgi:cytoskeletal protein RodZ
MRGRTVLFVVLAVATALVAAYLGWSTGTPKAAGNPSAPSKGVTHHEASGSAPAARSSASKGSATKTSPPKASPPKASPPKASPPKASPPKVSPPKATPKGCLTADAKPAAYVTPADEEPATRTENEPATDPASDAAAQAAEGDDEVRFGPMAEGSHGHVDTNIAPDRQALTTGFDNLEVEVGNGKLTNCDATRSYTMTIPLTGGGHRSVLRFHVQGFAFVQKGVTARLTVRGNGRTTARDFPAGTDDSFLQTVELPATPGTTYRLETVVQLHQDPDTYRTAGYLNVAAIDVEIV